MIEFILFFVCTTAIFFLPNAWWVISGSCMVALTYCLLRRIRLTKVAQKIIRIVPFILLTFVLNVWLDSLEIAVFIVLKLLIACWITLAYSQTLSSLELARIVSDSLSPLHKLGFDTYGVYLIICLALSITPILRREVTETKYAMRAKNMNLNIRNLYCITTYLLTRLIKRVDELDLSLRSKGIFD